MNAKPIIFNAPMIRAVLDGSKTQTRRMIKPQPTHFNPVGAPRLATPHGASLYIDCPYGKPGDQLWVKETWALDPPFDGTWAYTEWAGCRDGQISRLPEQFRNPKHCIYAASLDVETSIRWTPSIHMPRWASRITLEITGVRVERLQDITEKDAWAEGIDAQEALTIPSKNAASAAFSALWESIYNNRPKLPTNTASKRYTRVKRWLETHPDIGSWDANPWVWVIEFKRIETKEQA